MLCSSRRCVDNALPVYEELRVSKTDSPSKTRELHSHHFDSTIWNDFRFRDDDIIISTYAKSGTTWMQQIIAQLLFNGEEGLNVAEMSPGMSGKPSLSWVESAHTGSRRGNYRIGNLASVRLLESVFPDCISAP